MEARAEKKIRRLVQAALFALIGLAVVHMLNPGLALLTEPLVFGVTQGAEGRVVFYAPGRRQAVRLRPQPAGAFVITAQKAFGPWLYLLARNQGVETVIALEAATGRARRVNLGWRLADGGFGSLAWLDAQAAFFGLGDLVIRQDLATGHEHTVFDLVDFLARFGQASGLAPLVRGRRDIRVAHWRPGRTLLYLDEKVMVRLEAGRAWPVGEFESPVLSRDGAALVFEGKGTDGEGVYRVEVDTGHKRRIACLDRLPGPPRRLALSQDGAYLAVSADTGTGPTYIVDIERDKPIFRLADAPASAVGFLGAPAGAAGGLASRLAAELRLQAARVWRW